MAKPLDATYDPRDRILKGDCGRDQGVELLAGCNVRSER